MKKVRFCFLTLLLVMVTSVFVCADEAEYLLDHADVLTTEEADLVEQRLEQVSADLSFYVRVVTEESMSGWDAEAIADSYYNALNDCGDGYLPGILLYICYSPRQYYITASNNVFNDDMTYTLEQSFLSYLREDDTYNALIAYCDTVQSLVYAYHGEVPSFPVDPYGSAEAPKGDYVPDYDPMPEYVPNGSTGDIYFEEEEVTPLPVWAVLALPFIDPTFFVMIIVLPLAAALFLTHLKVKQMNNAQKQTGAAAFMNAESLNLTKSKEIFLYSNVVSTPKPQNNASHPNHGGGFSGSHHGGFSGGGGASGRVGRGGSF